MKIIDKILSLFGLMRISLLLQNRKAPKTDNFVMFIFGLFLGHVIFKIVITILGI